MSSLFIIGETGESTVISSFSQFKTHIDLFLKNTSCTLNDILIYTNKGQSYISSLPNEITPETHYFIYTKKHSPDLITIFRNSLISFSNPFSHNISLDLKCIPDIKYVTSSIPLLEENAKYLKNFTPQDFKNSLLKMNDFYDNFKLIYSSMQNNCDICDKIKKCYEFQFEGVDLLNKSLGNLYEKCQFRRREIEKKLKSIKENNDSILKNYKESVEQLKITELHPSMQTNKNKYLIDIFFNENQIESWKKKCINDENDLFEKLNIIDAILLKEKNKIISEKNSSMQYLKNELNSLKNEYEKLNREKRSKPFNIMGELSNEFVQFNAKFGSIIEIFNSNLYSQNPNLENKIDESVECIRQLKLKYSNLTLLSNLQTFLEPIGHICNKMKKSMEKLPKKINEILNNCLIIKRGLNDLYDKIDRQEKKFIKLEQAFKVIERSSKFSTIYKNSLDEIKRRLQFNKNINKEIDILRGIITKENINRRTFIKNYENYLPSDYLKIFKFCDVKLYTDLQNNNELKYLPNILFEDDNNNNKSELHNEQTLFKMLSSKIEEYDNLLRHKDNEIKKLQYLLEQSEKHFNSTQNEIRALSSMYDTMTDKFLYQLSIKDQRYESKKKEFDNLQKYISSSLSNSANNSNTTQSSMEYCLLCKERITNSKDMHSTSHFIKELQDKLASKVKIIYQLEKNYQELIYQTNEIKKTFFKHMNAFVEKKNKEIMTIKSHYENRAMYAEDVASIKYAKDVQEQKLQNYIQQLEKKNKDIVTRLQIFEHDNKNLHLQIEELKQKGEDLKTKNIDYQKQLEMIITDKSTLESTLEIHKIRAQQLTNENVSYLKELSQTKGDLELKTKENIALTKFITKQKEDLIELNTKYTDNLNEVEILKHKLDSLENEINEKDKKIYELTETACKTYVTTKTGITNEINTNYMNSEIFGVDDVIHYKKIEKGINCIFVPHSEGVYVCINLSENEGESKLYKCKYVLNFSAFDEELKELIIENSLIVIGKVGGLVDYTDNKMDLGIELPENEKIMLVSLDKIEFVIGFPEEDLMFKNYI